MTTQALIGTTTTYLGDEIPGLQRRRVRVHAILRGAVRPDVNVDASDYYVSDDDDLARLGGVTAADRVEVAEVKPDGRESFVRCDPRAIDLECFRSCLS